jgi:hypothetical protein
MYICDRSKYQGQLTDQKRFMDEKDYAQKSGRMKRLIDGLDTAITGIDEKIRALIEGDADLTRQRELLCSWRGRADGRENDCGDEWIPRF